MSNKNFKPAFYLATSIVLAASLASCGGGGGYSGGSPSTAVTTATFSSNLDSKSETPPNTSPASGLGSVVAESATKMMTATVATKDIVGTAAHIHEGAVGVAGPIVFPLTETTAGSGKWGISKVLTDAELATLKAGGYYFNVHSTTFPSGEIRGQITSTGVVF
jgi:hypothetical protein